MFVGGGGGGAALTARAGELGVGDLLPLTEANSVDLFGARPLKRGCAVDPVVAVVDDDNDEEDDDVLC